MVKIMKEGRMKHSRKDQCTEATLTTGALRPDSNNAATFIYFLLVCISFFVTSQSILLYNLLVSAYIVALLHVVDS